MRTTLEVFEDHLAKRLDGNIDEDIATNYADHVVMLTNTGAYHGHDGVRTCANKLAEVIAEGEYAYDKKLVEGEYAWLEWSAKDKEKGTDICDGADSFVIRDGKIVFQSVQYKTA